MEVIRDLIRDLVGVLFPGGLFVFFTLWLFFGILIVVVPLDSINVFSIGDNLVGFLVLLVLSYVAGQYLRMRRLSDLERECTIEYRKRHKSQLTDQEFDESIENIKREEKSYYEGKSELDSLTAVYEQHNRRFGVWEEFPYPYLLKGRRLSRHPTGYNEFFGKYDQQGLTNYQRFFNFCKSVIYEYSPSFKEEVLRQEALVRLFAGIYYVMKYGRFVSIVMATLHVTMIISSFQFRAGFLSYTNLEYSYAIVFISAFAYFAFRYLNTEILGRLRFMRVKELELAYDGFYLICNRHNLDFS